MKKLTKADLHLAGSSFNVEDLCVMALEKLGWQTIVATKSERYQSRLGTVYDVSNAKGLVPDAVVIVKTRASFYWIK